MITLGTLLAAVDEALGGPPQFHGCSPATEVDDLAVDSRLVRPGTAFLALRGHTHDGIQFIADSYRRGAAVVIARHGTETSGPRVELPDPERAYPVIAANRHGWPARGLQLAAVTGTNGKTTTAHLVAAILAHARCPHVRLGTTGNWLVDEEVDARFTTPFPLEMQALLSRGVHAGATHGVLEASSHALVQGRLRPLIFRAIALTSFSQDHLDYHENMDEYLAAKCVLATEHLAENGVAVAAEQDGPASAMFLAAARAAGGQAWLASVRGTPGADLRVSSYELGAFGITATLATPMGETKLRSPLLGDYNLSNLLVAVGLGLSLGLELETIIAGLSQAHGAPGRLERVVGPSRRPAPAVLVDYAHTPDAVRRVLDTIRPLCKGRVFIVLGCGGDRDPSKRPRMGQIAAEGSDRFYATSDNPRSEDPDAIIDAMVAGVPKALETRVIREVDRARAIERSIREAQPDDIVILAGKGHETYQILPSGTIAFDDREHARAALARRI